MPRSDPIAKLETPKRCRNALAGTALILFAVVQFLFLPRARLFTDKEVAFTREPFSCSFRDYDQNPDRLYGITHKDYPPPFLRVAFYIYGKPPVLLPHSHSEDTNKVCSHGEALIMDGTNPSILSLSKLQQMFPSNTTVRVPWSRLPNAAYLVSTTFKTNHQCQYFSYEKKKTRFAVIPGRKKRDADLLIVDSQIQTLWQSHIWDATTLDSKDNATHYIADDVRLFLHDGEIWMSYKRYSSDGEGFLGSTQRINRLKFGYHDMELVAMADPAQEIELCCGRNFGVLSHSEATILSFLTWPDPVFVQSLDTRAVLSKGNHYVEFEKPDHIKSRMPNNKASEFHGTSNQLLYIADWNEYLGIGHLHRERKWNKNRRKDAAYGHHYTHAFFTISATRPYHLKRLSQEFLFPSQVNPADGDVIQFASGLEWATPNHQIAIGYGINDCEGAIIRVDWNIVESMLKTVAVGTQVAHTMRNLTREIFLEHDASPT